MPELLSYSLADLLPFSRETYFRLFELYNAAIWPAPAVFIVSGAALIWLALEPAPARGRAIAISLAAGWFWVGIAFHYVAFAKINWAAPLFGAFFVLQALLLLLCGTLGQPLQCSFSANRGACVGGVLVAFAILVQPLMGLMSGRLWSQLSIFGAAPDPTVVATLGIVLMATGRPRWELMAIPIAWCLVSFATASAMQLTDAWAMPAIALAVLLVALYRRFG